MWLQHYYQYTNVHVHMNATQPVCKRGYCQSTVKILHYFYKKHFLIIPVINYYSDPHSLMVSELPLHIFLLQF